MDFSNFQIVTKFPNEKEFQNLIRFFLKIGIKVKDITSEIEKSNFQKVVEVTYTYNNHSYLSKPLFYKNILNAPSVKNSKAHTNYFGDDVYWLDIEKHDWPKPKGHTDIDTLIINDITDDDNFKTFLKLLANNISRGAIQRITAEGRTNQYFRNLENNNHWHDIILLIQEAISNASIRKEFFKPLVFRWDGNHKTDRLRVSLDKKFGARKFIDQLLVNIKKYKSPILYQLDKMKDNKQIVDLLEFKKQIILQGPPGTGKTRLAKEIASDLIFEESIDNGLTKEIIISDMTSGLKFPSAMDRIEYEVEKVTSTGISVIASSKKSYVPLFSEIIKSYTDQVWEKEGAITKGNDSYSAAIAKYIFLKQKQYNSKLENSLQFKLIQFHPSYSYEDFVRGIVAKPSNDGDGIIFEAENKVLASFCKEAYENFVLSNVKEQNSISDIEIFKDFVSNLTDKITESDEQKWSLTDAVYLFAPDEKRFKYKGDNWIAHSKGLNMKFSELEKILLAGIKERFEIKKLNTLEELTRQHASYFIKVIELFYEFKKNHSSNTTSTIKSTVLKNYVLIIDEINRANLSSVLGELIYGLEYRGEAVESMYAIDGNKSLTLPPNLYIIGTMNTADRSVGHIDYAIRRRFAFVDVLPQVLENSVDMKFDETLFVETSKLFIKDYNPKVNYSELLKIERSAHLSEDFNPKDVWLGHSYFIDKTSENGSMAVRLKYEIIPILLEYVKDGILKESALTEIEKLKASF